MSLPGRQLRVLLPALSTRWRMWKIYSPVGIQICQRLSSTQYCLPESDPEIEVRDLYIFWQWIQQDANLI